MPLLHLLLPLWLRQGQPRGSRWLRVLIGLLAHQAVWKVAAESYVVATNRRAYRASRPPLARLVYVGFWTRLTTLSILGTLFLLRREETPDDQRLIGLPETPP